MSRRLLLVHAHPDDEVIGTGATIARYVWEGAQVTLVTCTLGEEGEIHVPELAQLAADQADQLGGYRIAEWRAATAALGLTDARFLGGAGHFRDSGMMGTPANDHPRAFWRAEVDTGAALVADIIRETRPQVLVTYDPNGFYGHPDHIQAHRVAMRGAELAAPDWQVQKIYWTAVPRSIFADRMAEFAERADNPFGDARTVEDLPFGCADEEIAARIDGAAFATAKSAAIRAYPTQIPPDNWLNTLADADGGALGVEYFRLAVGARGVPDGWEDDLFAGVVEDGPATEAEVGTTTLRA
jgi:N-acetyl-1-D-myo-inositol-2-amino-2-deoxy-alpha-D-glucopyranoside deacetylase